MQAVKSWTKLIKERLSEGSLDTSARIFLCQVAILVSENVEVIDNAVEELLGANHAEPLVIDLDGPKDAPSP